MPFFLAKTDPSTYTAAQLQADRQTTWDGVTNPQAVAAIAAMRSGDLVFIYHSGGQSAIVALAQVVSNPLPDPANPKSKTVTLRFLRHIDPPTTLADVKASGLFNDWALVRQSRLSTMAVPDSFVLWMRARYPRLKL